MHLQAWFAQVLLHALNERGHLILSRPCITSINQRGHLHTHIVLCSIIHTFSDFAWSSAGDHLSLGFSMGMVSPAVLSPRCRRLWVWCDNCRPIAYTAPVTMVSQFLRCFSQCEVAVCLNTRPSSLDTVQASPPSICCSPLPPTPLWYWNAIWISI